MSRFWEWLSNLSPGEIARSGEVNDNFSQIDAGFDEVEGELNRTIRFTGDTSPAESYFQVPDNAAQRALKSLMFDALGKVTVGGLVWQSRGDWATATNYVVNDVVRAGVEGSVYVCIVAHLSTTAFGTDLAAGRWVLVLDMLPYYYNLRRSQIITTNRAAVQGDDLMVDVTAGPITITLPATPTINDAAISVTHIDGNIVANPITIARNGQRIMGLLEDMTVNDTNAAFELAFSDAARGWRLVRGT